jgi:hypothetical protein
VPALLAIAVNVHGGVLAAAGIFFLWVGLILISTVFREKSLAVVFAPANRMIILVSFAAIAALALNPYGIRLPVFLLRTATVARPEIAEWQPIALISVEGLVYVLLLVVSCMGMIFSRKERRPAVVILFACTAMLPLIASRHMPLFGLSCAVLIGEHIADMWDRGAPAADATGADDARSSWFAVACLVAAPVMIAIAWPNFQCIRVDGRKTEFPVRAVALLKQTNATGNLVVHFDWGEYALWHLGPRMKVSIDGRRETVYSERSYAENLRFTNGVGDWDRLLKEPKTQVALVSRAFPVFNLMRLTSGWKLAYEDPISGIFVRQGSPLEEALRLTRRPEMPHNGAGLCFP